MAVIYIGDRQAGKTHLALELANTQAQYVKVKHPSYDYLKSLLYDEETRSTRATRADRAIHNNFLEVDVQLPTSTQSINLDWHDTTGEIWRKNWQESNQGEWQNFLTTIKGSSGILLILPPYRELVRNNAQTEELITQQQWCNRFQRWVDFFRYDCPQIRHLLLCLNKADLFCDLQQEGNRLGYKPHNSRLNWHQRNQYVFDRYFRPVHPQIQQLNQNLSSLSVRCFITSIYSRPLLELPWIYLGSFLAK